MKQFSRLAHLCEIILAVGILAMASSELPRRGATDVVTHAGRSMGKICENLPGSRAGNSYLTVDEMMELETGSWGRSGVHPLGPNFFRYQRQMKDRSSRPSSCQRLSAGAPGLLVTEG